MVLSCITTDLARGGHDCVGAVHCRQPVERQRGRYAGRAAGESVWLRGDQFFARISDGFARMVDQNANLNIDQRADAISGAVSVTRRADDEQLA